MTPSMLSNASNPQEQFPQTIITTPSIPRSFPSTSGTLAPLTDYAIESEKENTHLICCSDSSVAPTARAGSAVVEASVVEIVQIVPPLVRRCCCFCCCCRGIEWAWVVVFMAVQGQRLKVAEERTKAWENYGRDYWQSGRAIGLVCRTSEWARDGMDGMERRKEWREEACKRRLSLQRLLAYLVGWATGWLAS